MDEQGTGRKRGRRAGGRQNGEGMAPRQRADGRWEARVTLPNGRQRPVYGKTQKEAREKLKALLTAQDAGLDLSAKRQTVGAFLERWLTEVASQKLEATTLNRYSQIIQHHLVPSLGRVPLDGLKPDHVQRMLNDKVALGLAPNSVKYCRAVLSSALSQAERWGMVNRNVAKLVSAPKPAGKKPLPLDAEQARALLVATSGDRLGPLYAVALYTGMRQGELLGLPWGAIDLDAGRLTVRQAMKRVKGEYTIGSPKSKTSRRTIPLPLAAVASLRKQRDLQAFERKKAGGSWYDSDLVFTRANGKPLDGRVVTKSLQDTLRHAGLPHSTFHALRHSCASLLLESGEPLAKVSRLLGHSTVTLTLDTYGHLSTEALGSAARTMDALFPTGT